jgi:hypothetical protein
MPKKYNLTNDEANLVKDILKALGKNDELNNSVASMVGMEENQFNLLADSIFSKLGNGRVTVES